MDYFIEAIKNKFVEHYHKLCKSKTEVLAYKINVYLLRKIDTFLNILDSYVRREVTLDILT